MANALKIIYLNCRGLGDKTKRSDVLNFLRQSKYNIYCLQDTHLIDAETNMLRSQWGYDCYISGKRTNSRGVAILMNSNFEYNLIEQKADLDGNYIILKLEIEKKFTILLVNIYGPNGDDPQFYENVEKEMADIECDHIIMCADWNTVQDYKLDCYNYKLQNNPKAREAISSIKKKHNLTDPWRVYNPESRRYTWSRKNSCKKARLDYFLISEELMTYVEKSKILPGYLTDHSMILLELRLTNFTKGRGFWRFNNSLLKDRQYIQQVKDIIERTKVEYAIPVYNRDVIKELSLEEIQFTISDQLFLEMLLLNIRGMTLPFCAAKKRHTNMKRETLERQLKLCYELSDDNPQNRFIIELIEDLNSQLESIRK